MNYTIIPIQEENIEAFWLSVGSVTLEREYLAFLEKPLIEFNQAIKRNLDRLPEEFRFQLTE